MKRIAKFHKVSEERFLKDWKDAFPETPVEKVHAIYEQLLSSAKEQRPGVQDTIFMLPGM